MSARTLIVGLVVVVALVFGGVRFSKWFMHEATDGGPKLGIPGPRAPSEVTGPLLDAAQHELSSGDATGADAHCTELLAKNPDENTYARVLFVRGSARVTKGDLRGGIGDLSRLIAKCHEHALVQEALVWRGRAYAQGGDLDKALADLDNCLDQTPTQGVRASARLERGLVKKRKGDLNGAREDIKWAADYSSGDIHNRAVNELNALQ